MLITSELLSLKFAVVCVKALLRHMFFFVVSHLSKSTTYEDPRKDVVDEPPKPREVDLIRDSDMGFGFVAGSEKPVIVRFVTEGKK